MEYLLVILAGTVGAVLGAIALYYLGLWLDEPVIRRFIRNFGKFFLLDENDLDRALEFFGRYGEAVIFFGRLIPIIRSLISIPAGMNRMPLGKFLIFTAFGTTVWNLVLTTAGMWLGENWQEILGIMDQYENVTLVVLVVVVLVFVGWKVKGMLDKRAATNSAE